MEGGDARRLTEFKRGVTEFEWMPNGRAVAVIATDGESHLLVGEREKGTATARVLRRVDWRSDDDGLLDHATHVHLVQLSGRARRLTEGPWSASHRAPRTLTARRSASSPTAASDRDIDPLAQLHVVDVRSRPRPRRARSSPATRSAPRSMPTARRCASPSCATRPCRTTRRCSTGSSATAPPSR